MLAFVGLIHPRRASGYETSSTRLLSRNALASLDTHSKTVFPTGLVENIPPIAPNPPALSRLKLDPNEFFQLIAMLIEPLLIECECECWFIGRLADAEGPSGRREVVVTEWKVEGLSSRSMSMSAIVEIDAGVAVVERCIKCS